MLNLLETSLSSSYGILNEVCGKCLGIWVEDQVLSMFGHHWIVSFDWIRIWVYEGWDTKLLWIRWFNGWASRQDKAHKHLINLLTITISITVWILSVVCKVIACAIKSFTGKPYVKSIFTFINGFGVRGTWTVKHKLNELRWSFVSVLVELFPKLVSKVQLHRFVLKLFYPLYFHFIVMNTPLLSLTKSLNTRLIEKLWNEA